METEFRFLRGYAARRRVVSREVPSIVYGDLAQRRGARTERFSTGGASARTWAGLTFC